MQRCCPVLISAIELFPLNDPGRSRRRTVARVKSKPSRSPKRRRRRDAAAATRLVATYRRANAFPPRRNAMDSPVRRLVGIETKGTGDNREAVRNHRRSISDGSARPAS